MRDQLEKRREELAGELEAGQRMLADLDARRGELTQTLLRISGALQVLAELLEPDGPATRLAAPAAPTATATTAAAV